eukprot:TRINITY_DN9238_c0_g1_i1.p1 TRINITY_DN9238_c0_g1~~TRINITY_DN9238_c0_g1_i1.p1  ORF type:complete len:325 (+),score=18.53 TRINITY_DN9238_c0_g1_i1:136-1110(+)
MSCIISCLVCLTAVLLAWIYRCYVRRLRQIQSARNPAFILYPKVLAVLSLVFDRPRAHLEVVWCDWQLPRSLRSPVLRGLSWLFKADVTEAKLPLESYSTIGEFFSRELREGARPINSLAGGFVSPVDGKVVALSRIDSKVGLSRAPQVQVKNATYSLQAFLGCDPFLSLGKSCSRTQQVLNYAVFHLSPGDYHRFHAPTDFTLTDACYFPGEAIPVDPLVSGLASDVFTANVRLVLSGRWSGGCLFLVAVGAYHCSSIFVSFDHGLAQILDETSSECHVPTYLGGEAQSLMRRGKKKLSELHVSKGDMLGGFRAGSAVVTCCG